MYLLTRKKILCNLEKISIWHKHQYLKSTLNFESYLPYIKTHNIYRDLQLTLMSLQSSCGLFLKTGHWSRPLLSLWSTPLYTMPWLSEGESKQEIRSSFTQAVVGLVKQPFLLPSTMVAKSLPQLVPRKKENF